MKNKLAGVIGVVFLCLIAFGCGSAKVDDNLPDNERFKVEYESANNKNDDHFHKMRAVTIPADNPIVYTSCEDVVNMIESGETFWIYCGFKKCPWCRGNVEAMLEAAEKCNVSKLYYLDVYTCRDIYALKKGEIKLIKKGDDSYMKLLDLLEPVLDEYTLPGENDEMVSVGEKRIYAPNIIRVNKGQAEKLTTGSEAFEDPYGDISTELYDLQLEEFVGFFG